MTNADDQREPDDKLHATAVRVARRLIDAGYTALFNGGCVRDRLMGGEPKDYDIATDATPEQVREVFPRARGVGVSFGVMLVRSGGFTIEIATFRSEGVYSDGRRPDEVHFSDAEHDALRRDFTINGLFEHPLTGEIIDYVGGRADLEAGVIRAIGDPAARLHEDRLRMLRAVRFAARLSFEIDPATAEAIRSGAGELRGVSRERIGQELRWMLSDRNRTVAARLIQALGLDSVVLDEPHRAVPLARLDRLPAEADYSLALAAWLLDRHGDAEDHGAAARRWTAALMLSNDESRQLKRSLAVRRTLLESWNESPVAGRKRLAASERFASGLLLLESEDEAAAAAVRAEVDRLAKTELAPAPLVDGNDLIELGFRPGPAFSRLLEAVYDAQLEGRVTSRAEALDLARRLESETERA
jgi:poly(A) polymerase